MVLFSFVLANESTPLLLLFTFGSAFVRKCEQKQSTLILLTISCWFCFRSYLRTKALHSYYYLLLALFSFVSANKSNPLWLLIISCWLCFHLYLQMKAWCHPYIFISCWLCFHLYSRTKAIHPLLFIIYFWLCFRS